MLAICNDTAPVRVVHESIDIIGVSEESLEASPDQRSILTLICDHPSLD